MANLGLERRENLDTNRSSSQTGFASGITSSSGVELENQLYVTHSLDFGRFDSVLDKLNPLDSVGMQQLVLVINQGIASLSLREREALRVEAEKALIKVSEYEYIRSTAASAITKVAEEAFTSGNLGNLVAENATYQLVLEDAKLIDAHQKARTGLNYWEITNAQNRNPMFEKQSHKAHRAFSQLAEEIDSRLKANLSETSTKQIDAHSRLVARYIDAIPPRIPVALAQVLVTRYMAQLVQSRDYEPDPRRVEMATNGDSSHFDIRRYFKRRERDISGSRKNIYTSIKPVTARQIMQYDIASLNADKLPLYFTEAVLGIGEDDRLPDGTVRTAGAKTEIYPAQPTARFLFDTMQLTDAIAGTIQLERSDFLTRTWVKSSSAAKEWFADPRHQESLLWAVALTGSAAGALAATTGQKGLQGTADNITHAVQDFSSSIDKIAHQDISQIWSSERFARVLSPGIAAAYSVITGKPDEATRIAADYLQTANGGITLNEFTKQHAIVGSTQLLLTVLIDACTSPQTPPPSSPPSYPIPPQHVDGTPTPQPPEPTPTAYQQASLYTDSLGRVVKPTEDLSRRLTSIRDDALKQLSKSMEQNPQLFKLKPVNYAVFEHDTLTSDGNNLENVAYLITDAKPSGISAKFLDNRSQEIQLEEGSSIYFWQRSNPSKALLIRLPEGINRFVFDAENNRLIIDFTDNQNKRTKGVIALTGDQAGIFVMEVPPPTIAPKPTEPPKPTPTEQVKRGKQIFTDTFESGNIESHWAGIADTGTKTEYVPDPKGTGKLVVRYTIAGDPVLDPTPNFTPKGLYWYTGYHKYIPEAGQTVGATEIKVLPSSDWKEYFGAFSAHGEDGSVRGFEINSKGNIITVTRVMGTDGKPLPDRRVTSTFTVNMSDWITLRMEFTAEQTRYFANGRLVATGPGGFKVKDVHGGLLAADANPERIGFVKGRAIHNKDFFVEAPAP